MPASACSRYTYECSSFLSKSKAAKGSKKDGEGKQTFPERRIKVAATLHKHIIFENVESRSTQSYYLLVVENM